MQNTVGIFKEISRTWTANDIMSLDYIKQSLGISSASTIFNNRLTSYIYEAIANIHKLTNSYILPTTVELKLNGFHNFKIIDYFGFYESNYFIINQQKIIHINSIEYKDIENVLRTLDSDKYILDTSSQFYTKVLSKEDSFPKTFTLEGRTFSDNVIVNFDCGLFASISDYQTNFEGSTIKNAIESYVKERFEDCEQLELMNMLQKNISEFIPVSYTVYE